MTFDKWHDWAMGNHAGSPRDNGKTWKRVATHARHDACYDGPGCGDDDEDPDASDAPSEPGAPRIEEGLK